MINDNRYIEEMVFAGIEEYPVLVDRQTNKVVKAYVRGKWINTKYITVWQDYYDGQKQIREKGQI